MRFGREADPRSTDVPVVCASPVALAHFPLPGTAACRTLLRCLGAIALLLLLASPSAPGQAPQQRHLRVRGDHHYPPYEYLDNDGRPAGYNVDLIRAVAEAMGLEIEIDLGPWHEVRAELEAGKIDALAGMYYSSRRDRLVDFSTPHMIVSHAVFVRKGSPVRSLEDARGAEILVQEGDIAHDFIVAKGVSERIVTVEDQEAALRLLASGQGDCAVLAKVQGLYLVRELELANVEAVGPPIEPREYCFAVRSGDTVLLTQLNEGLRVLEHTGEYKEIRDKWFGVYEQVAFMRRLATYGVWVLTPVALLLAAAIGWSWFLKRRMAQKTRELADELAGRARAEGALRASEEQRRSMFDGVPVGLYRSTPDGTLLDANVALTHLLRYPDQATMLAIDVTEIYAAPDSRQQWLERMEREGVVRGFEVRLRRYDGTTILARHASRAIRDEQGRTLYFEGSIEDITEQKHIEEELQASERRFAEANQMLQAVLDTVPVRLFWKDVNLRYLGCNRLFAQDAGLNSPEEIIGQDDFALGWREQAEMYRADDHAVIESLKPRLNYEEPQTTPDGRKIWLRTSKIPLRDMDGKVIGVLGTYEDITERKEEEHARARLKAQLHHSQKMEAVGQLAGGVAHDFNNLLTVILGNVDQLRVLLPAPSEVGGMLDAIERATDQATGVTRSLLTFSHKLPIEKKLVDLCRIVQRATSLLDRLLPASVELTVDVDSDGPLTISADDTQLQQVVLNLAINSRDAMPDGGSLRVSVGQATEADLSGATVALDPGARYAVLTVADTGCGMPPDVQGRVFEPFFTTKGRGQGTGLGLSIVHGIVREHDGRIYVASEVGVGSSFRIFLPLAGRDVPDGTGDSVLVAPRGQGETILLAEDDPFVRETLTSALRLFGYEVLQATTGEELLSVYRQYVDTIQLLIFDVDLPKRSGLECLRDIRAEGATIPAIIVTGSVDPDIESQVDSDTLFLRKPLQLKTLGRWVHQSLRHGQQRESTP